MVEEGRIGKFGRIQSLKGFMTVEIGLSFLPFLFERTWLIFQISLHTRKIKFRTQIGREIHFIRKFLRRRNDLFQGDPLEDTGSPTRRVPSFRSG